jgi:hypothetical protein
MIGHAPARFATSVPKSSPVPARPPAINLFGWVLLGLLGIGMPTAELRPTSDARRRCGECRHGDAVVGVAPAIPRPSRSYIRRWGDMRILVALQAKIG